MTITYIAKRFRDGVYHCHDVIADGQYLNLYLAEGATVEKITKYAAESLDAPFPARRPGDTVQVLIDKSATVEEMVIIEVPETEPGLPAGTPDMKWKAVEIQNYLGAHKIAYGDGDTKRVMLDLIPNV